MNDSSDHQMHDGLGEGQKIRIEVGTYTGGMEMAVMAWGNQYGYPIN